MSAQIGIETAQVGWRTNASQKRKPTQVKRVACLGADPQVARGQLWWLTGQPLVVISVGLETVRSQLLQFDIQFFLIAYQILDIFSQGFV